MACSPAGPCASSRCRASVGLQAQQRAADTQPELQSPSPSGPRLQHEDDVGGDAARVLVACKRRGRPGPRTGLRPRAASHSRQAHRASAGLRPGNTPAAPNSVQQRGAPRALTLLLERDLGARLPPRPHVDLQDLALGAVLPRGGIQPLAAAGRQEQRAGGRLPAVQRTAGGGRPRRRRRCPPPSLPARSGAPAPAAGGPHLIFMRRVVPRASSSRLHSSSIS